MNSSEITDYPENAVDEGRLKLNRDPFGRRLYRALGENRGTEHDFFNDDELILRAARLISNATSPEAQQVTIATIRRDLAVFHLYVLRGIPDGLNGLIDMFMEKVRVSMRQGNCVPLLIDDLSRVSEKAKGSVRRLLLVPFPKNR